MHYSQLRVTRVSLSVGEFRADQWTPRVLRDRARRSEAALPPRLGSSPSAYLGPVGPGTRPNNGRVYSLLINCFRFSYMRLHPFSIHPPLSSTFSAANHLLAFWCFASQIYVFPDGKTGLLSIPSMTKDSHKKHVRANTPTYTQTGASVFN